MTITFVTGQATGADVASTSSATNLTLAGNTTAGNTVLVAVRIGSSTVTAAVTDGGGNTYAADSPFNPTTDSTNSDRLYLFRCSSVVTPTSTITCTPSGGAATIRWSAAEYNFGGTASVLDQTQSHFQTVGGSATADSNNTATTTNANELLFGFCKTEAAHTFTAGTGYTKRDGENKECIEDKIVSATGAYNSTIVNDALTDQVNANAWLQCIATYYAASSFAGDDEAGLTFSPVVTW